MHSRYALSSTTHQQMLHACIALPSSAGQTGGDIACRALREEMYRANITRASSGEKDNSPIIEKVLSLKNEKAHLLGYDNFAEVSMASKVHSSP